MPILIPPFRFVLSMWVNGNSIPDTSNPETCWDHQYLWQHHMVQMTLCLWYMANLFSGSEFSVDVLSAISVASLLCCSPQLCVAPIGNFISLHFSFNRVRFVCCFAFPRRLFSFFSSDLSQFTVLVGISVPATLQHMSFLKCFFSFCALYKAGFTFDSYFLFARGTGKAGIFLKLLLHNFFSSPSCLLWVAPVLGTAELPDELLCGVSALLWMVFRRSALHSWKMSQVIMK